MRSVRQVCLKRMAWLSALVAVGLLSTTSSFAADARPMKFKVRIANIAHGDVLKLSSGGLAVS